MYNTDSIDSCIKIEFRTAMADHNYDRQIWNRPALPNKVNPEEDIVIVTREDLIVLFSRGLGLFLVFFALLIARTFALGVFDSFMLQVFDVFFFSVNVLLVTTFALFFHNYYLSIQIVTSERLIDIDQKGLFNREVNILPLENIEDVNYKQSGFWGTVFNFGNVIVQSAGDEKSNSDAKTSGFVFENVPTPALTASRITELYQQFQEQQARTQAQYTAEAIHGRFNPHTH